MSSPVERAGNIVGKSEAIEAVARRIIAMGLIELVVSVCAVAQPTQCEDQHLQYASAGSLRQCAMSAPPYIAQWIGDHPKWNAVRWHCEYPGEGKPT
jgi:hypothetical protein